MSSAELERRRFALQIGFYVASYYADDEYEVRPNCGLR